VTLVLAWGYPRHRQDHGVFSWMVASVRHPHRPLARLVSTSFSLSGFSTVPNADRARVLIVLQPPSSRFTRTRASSACRVEHTRRRVERLPWQTRSAAGSWPAVRPS